MLPQSDTTEATTSRESGPRDDAVRWLHGRINYERTSHLPYGERQLKLDRMRTLLVRLGQPDAALRIVHVAGTKGKGSTAAMIAAILTAAGFRTGVYSSPHLERIEERFAVDGQPCSRTELANLVDRVRPIVTAMDAEAAAAGDPQGGPTYFEVTTAIALLHFVERQVDAAVLEVGLGGRLDATNVCLPAVSVITNISFDHMQQLGPTLAAIAAEKAGIIKPGVPVVCGATNPEPQEVIARIAREHGCRLLQLGSDFRYTYRPAQIDFRFAVAERELALDQIDLAMRGPHQAANAALALATAAELRQQGWCISTDAMRSGLAKAKLPGRVEVFAGHPTVVLDTAHNPASARALTEALAELPAAGRRTLILAASRDKDVPAIVRELVPRFDQVVVTQYRENPRAVPADDLAATIRANCDVRDLVVYDQPREAWDFVRRSADPDELVCIAGSFYLAAELRAAVKARETLAV